MHVIYTLGRARDAHPTRIRQMYNAEILFILAQRDIHHRVDIVN
jgi:hypothetical protein